MDKQNGVLTVFFEGAFWVGVFERIENGKLSAAKVTFGAEPKDSEVWEFVLKRYDQLQFSPAVKMSEKQTADNPKRRQRDAAKQMRSQGIGTKSQQALSLMQEEHKTERRQISRARREAEKQRQFDLKQQKRREKHKGH
ncbi:MAG: YjdF family protein [Oscillospiraceae bacterium]|nr:YjdF family protein [Oscillospiraceae bacterium]